MPPRKTKSFSVSIITVFSLLIIVFAGVIIGYNYYKSSSNSYVAARDINRKITENVKDKVISLLRGPSESLSILSGVSDKLSDFKPLMWEILASEREYASLFHGNEAGDFIQVRRNPELAERTIGMIDGARMDTWVYKDWEGNVLKTESSPAAYDPTKRAWYKDSLVEDWFYLSPPYIFASTDEPGITISMPDFGDGNVKQGVYGIDITLNGLVRFIRKQSAITRGEIVIYDQNRTVIASTLDVDSVTEVRHLKRLEDIDNGVVNSILENPDQDSVTDGQGVGYIFTTSSFPTGYGARWHIITYTPENLILGDIRKVIYQSILISLVVLFLVIAAVVFISRRVSNPIVEIAEASRSLKKMDLAVSINSDSNIKEIRQAQDALLSLKSGLASFKRYMPADLVNRLIQAGQVAKVGGQVKDLAIMFTDIENFTTISESLSPEELTTQLSEYLDHVVHIILENEGTIDKYIGDAVLAFWGAPEDVENAVHKAVKAAILIHEKLDEVNREWSAQGKPELKTRIGIHYGKTLVGNIGSNERLNYTIIGDNVNIASRLEGANKQYGTKIIISQAVHDIVKDDFESRSLDSIMLKGKTEPVKIYSVEC